MKFPLKSIVCGVCLLAGVSAAHAEDVALCLSLNDGTVATYVLADMPVMTFDDDHIIFTASEASTSYLRTDVTDISFKKIQSGIADIAADECVMRYINRTVEADGRAITVYSVDGRLAASGRDRVDVSKLAPGIYIATAGKQTLKIKL